MRRVLIPVLSLALVAAVCGDDSGGQGPAAATAVTAEPAAQEVESVDGVARISLPAGQLAASVTIEPTEFDETILSEGYEAVAAYKLGPDGAEFTEPATLTIDTGVAVGDDGAVPVMSVIIGSGDAWEFPNQSFDASGGTVVMTAEVEHFSQAAVLFWGWTLKIDPAEITARVDKEFGVMLTVSQPGDERSPFLDRNLTRYDPRASGKVTRLSALIDVIGVTPNLVSGVALLESKFACFEPGAGEYGFDVEVRLELQEEDDDESIYSVAVVFMGSVGASLASGERTWSGVLVGTAACQEARTVVYLPVFVDPFQDCRDDADAATECAAGTDILETSFGLNDGVLVVDLELADAPILDGTGTWIAEIDVSTEAGGAFCNLSNSTLGGPVAELTATGASFSDGVPFPPETCTGTLDGTSVHLEFSLPDAFGTYPKGDWTLGGGTWWSPVGSGQNVADDLFVDLPEYDPVIRGLSLIDVLCADDPNAVDDVMAGFCRR